MKIKLKFGLDQLLFGMKQNDVEKIYGKANKSYKDEDDNLVLLYNTQKLRLTFYKDEDFKLGYIVASHPEVYISGIALIGKSIALLKNELTAIGINNFTQDVIDTYDTYFNEQNWLILQSEFDEIVKIEIGAIINNDDEFEWKF